MESKTCLKCQQTLPVDSFYYRKERKAFGSYCKQCHCKKTRQYYQDHKEDYTQKRKQREASESYKKARRARKIKRKKSNPVFALACLLRSRMNHAIAGRVKSISSEQLLGCTFAELKDYLESKWEKGMTWENRGFYGWHVDHIIPLSSANTLAELEKLFHYTNLQPLWGVENIRKGNKIA